jgi:hypothetical protein
MRHWKVILSIIAIFIAGIVTGSVLTLRVVKTVANNNLNPDRYPMGLLENYQRRLKLTPEQMEKMRPVIEETRKEWAETVRRTVGMHMGIMRRVDEQLAPLLTDDQKKVADEMREEMRKKARERMGGKGPGPFPGGPGGRPAGPAQNPP